MRIDIVTIFPAMIEHALRAGIVGRAIERGTLQIAARDLREFTTDRHRVVDDVPYGGGPGMVLKPEPLFRAIEAIEREQGSRSHVVLTSPQGTPLTQNVGERLSRLPHLLVLCGRYEGVDERVRARVDEEISIGDYVLSGGELAALVIADVVARFIPGVVGDDQSVAADSFSRGLLDFPQYTRPADYRGMKVPDVLLSGNHAEIEQWRWRKSIEQTLLRRPDLIEAHEVSPDQRLEMEKILQDIDQRRAE